MCEGWKRRKPYATTESVSYQAHGNLKSATGVIEPQAFPELDNNIFPAWYLLFYANKKISRFKVKLT